MSRFKWHEKGSNIPPSVFISFGEIGINKKAMEGYFDKDQLYVMIAYDAETQTLAIKPTHSTNRRTGWRLTRSKNTSTVYINARSFVEGNKLALTNRTPYTNLAWDTTEECLLVKGVCQRKEVKP